MDNSEAVTILLVEDDEIDSEAIRRAFRKLKIANPMVLAKDGIEALDHLRGTNGQATLPRPYLILLDLNMPRMNGLEFLAELRADPTIADSIVFVLTTSDLDADKVKAYGHRVAGYTLKNKVGDSFLGLVNLVEAYWRVVEFPPVLTHQAP